MKYLAITALVLLSSTSLMAEQVKSSKTEVNVGRVVDLVKLVSKPDVQVNVVVVDLGGSTDVSPTQKLYFNIYSKGEMFSTDASFDLGGIYSFKKATRIAGGIYELVIEGSNDETSMPEAQTLVVDAQKAIVNLKKVQCDDFDCDASTKFEAAIEVKRK